MEGHEWKHSEEGSGIDERQQARSSRPWVNGVRAGAWQRLVVAERLSGRGCQGRAASGGSRLGCAGGAAARSALLCRAGTEKRERGGKREKRE